MSWPAGRPVGRKCRPKGRPRLARPKAGYEVLGPWAAQPVPVPVPAPVPAPVPVPVPVGLESQPVFAPSFSSTAAPSGRQRSRSAARARLEVLETCSAVGEPSPLSTSPSPPSPSAVGEPAPGSPVPMPGPAPVPGPAWSAETEPGPAVSEPVPGTPVSEPVPGTRPAPGPAMARQSRPDPALFARSPSPTDDLASLVPPPPVGEGAAPLPFGAVARELVRSRCAECRLRTCDCPDDVAAAPSHPWARRRSVLARPESRCGRNHLYCLCADRACGTRWHLLIGDGSLDGIQWPDEVGRP